MTESLAHTKITGPILNLTESEKEQILNAINTLAAEEYRLLGVATASFAGSDFPDKQQNFDFDFQGFVAFYDPPKKNISSVLTEFYSAGIAVKIITGDNHITTDFIARQIGFQGHDRSINGKELMQLNEEELKAVVAVYYLSIRTQRSALSLIFL